MKYRCPLKILYEDNQLLAVDKPAGLLTIATAAERTRTAYYQLTDYVRRGNARRRIFVVHRLDRDTSGVLLVAKSEDMKRALQDGWNERALQRGYLAVAEGAPRDATGVVTSWLKENRAGMVYSAPKAGDGQQAITEYRLLGEKGGYALMALNLKTGRRNQIRVHLSDLGCPVAGDKKYGAATNPLNRLCLHAHVLELIHPTTGRPIRFDCPPPPRFYTLAGVRD